MISSSPCRISGIGAENDRAKKTSGPAKYCRPAKAKGRYYFMRGFAGHQAAGRICYTAPLVDWKEKETVINCLGSLVI